MEVRKKIDRYNEEWKHADEVRSSRLERASRLLHESVFFLETDRLLSMLSPEDLLSL